MDWVSCPMTECQYYEDGECVLDGIELDRKMRCTMFEEREEEE